MLASDQPLSVRARTYNDTAGVLHVEVAGDIDMASAPVLRDTLSSLVVRYQAQRRPAVGGHLGATSVELDLSAVTFLSRAGFDALLTFGESLTGELTLTSLSRPVRRLLHALPPPVLPKGPFGTPTAADVPDAPERERRNSSPKAQNGVIALQHS